MANSLAISDGARGHAEPQHQNSRSVPPPQSVASDYLTAREVGALLHRDPKTVRKWVARFHLGRRHGVFKMPGGGYLFKWEMFEKEFVQRQGDVGDES